MNLRLNLNIYMDDKVVGKNLANVLKENKFKKALLVAGKESIKKNGLYDDTIKQCKEAGVEVIEHWGVKPNPRHTHVDEGAKLIKDNKCDVVLALGGGSVIDASKGMSVASNNDCKIWSIVKNEVKDVKAGIPIIAAITLSATGSENNSGAVIQNEDTHEKRAFFHPSALPIATFIDPNYLKTVSKWQTACGSFDVISHLLEQFFTAKEFDWTQEYIIANLKTVLRWTPIALKDPSNYQARENIAYASSMSLNGLASSNDNSGSWDVHGLQHATGALWDITHGAGLAIITIEWMRTLKDRKIFKERLIRLGESLWDISDPDKVINKLSEVIKGWDIPLALTGLEQINEVTDNDIEELTTHFMGSEEKFGVYDLTRDEVKQLYKKVA